MIKIYILFFLTLLPPAYLCTRCLLWREIPAVLRGIICLLLIVSSQMMLINHFVFKNLAGPDMPSWLLLTQAAFFSGEIFLFLCFLARDLLHLLKSLLLLFHRKRHPRELYSNSISRREFFKYGLYTGFFTMGASCLSLGTATKAIAEGTADPILHKMEVVHPNLPRELEGMRIVQISDIHIGTLTSTEWAGRLVDLANAQKPDLICLCGDLADGLPNYRCSGDSKRIEAAQEFKRFKSTLGVFSCTGNHEYYGNDGNYEAWMNVYKNVGIHILEDAHVELNFNGADFALVGRADRAISRIGKTSLPAKEIMGKVSNGLFSIMLDHRPIRAKENAEAGAALQFSGHTHGGQCIIMDRAVAASNEGFLRGWYRVNSMPLYVSTGAGLWSGFPLRLGISPEVNLIMLSKGVDGIPARGGDI